jgi:hypothetical protein
MAGCNWGSLVSICMVTHAWLGRATHGDGWAFREVIHAGETGFWIPQTKDRSTKEREYTTRAVKDSERQPNQTFGTGPHPGKDRHQRGESRSGDSYSRTGSNNGSFARHRASQGGMPGFGEAKRKTGLHVLFRCH